MRGTVNVSGIHRFVVVKMDCSLAFSRSYRLVEMTAGVLAPPRND